MIFWVIPMMILILLRYEKGNPKGGNENHVSVECVKGIKIIVPLLLEGKII
jgi:hypothetical protein